MDMEIKYYYRYNLQLFASDDGGEKTEEPTAKKLEDARKKGQAAQSKDLTSAMALIALFISLKILIGYLGESFLGVFKTFFDEMSKAVSDEFTLNAACSLIGYVLQRIILIAWPVMLAGFVVTIVSLLAQVKWKISTEPLMPKFDKFNPISGFKQMFSKTKLMNLVTSVAKILVIAWVVYDYLRDQWGMLLNFYSMNFFSCIAFIGDTVISLGLKISVFFLIVALADFAFQKWKFHKDMMMSKQEIKDEYKQSEGDPQVKGQIRQKMRQAAQRRMMQELPKADVVITNPTHLAVAILYDKEKYDAPIVIAKGADYLAQKIKENAAVYHIEIVENKPLARMLYYNVEIGAQIPPELYQMVAEVLAYVYNLKGRLSHQA